MVPGGWKWIDEDHCRIMTESDEWLERKNHSNSAIYQQNEVTWGFRVDFFGHLAQSQTHYHQSFLPCGLWDHCPSCGLILQQPVAIVFCLVACEIIAHFVASFSSNQVPGMPMPNHWPSGVAAQSNNPNFLDLINAVWLFVCFGFQNDWLLIGYNARFPNRVPGSLVAFGIPFFLRVDSAKMNDKNKCQNEVAALSFDNVEGGQFQLQFAKPSWHSRTQSGTFKLGYFAPVLANADI